MSAHTPGPWTMEYVGDSKALVRTPLARSGPHEPQTYVLARVEDWTPEKTQAAARLIAAAPELLEALTEMTEIMVEDGYSNTIVKKARTAIAKAKGGD